MYGADPNAAAAYYRLMNCNAAAQVYRIAGDVGIYEALGRNPATTAEIADACQLQLRPTELLCGALRELGLIECDEGRYALAPLAHMLLHTDYRELGNQYWRHLPEFLATGQPLKRVDKEAESEIFYQAQAASLGWMLAPVARHAAQLLRIGTTRRDLQILDLGAGSAIWSLSFAAADVGSRVTAVDRPAVLEVAQETAEQLSLADRLTTLPGDFHELPLPKGMFDLAVIANVTHLEDPERTGRLFVAARQALKPTGELLVVDVLPGDPQGDLPRALYELGLALRTENGRVYSAQQLETLLRDAGFSSLKLLPLDVPPHTIGMLLASGPRDDSC